MMVWGYFSSDHVKLEPLEYTDSNQETIIGRVLEALDDNDIVYLQGGVGSGKSVIALHIIAHHRKGVIAVPTKNLETQYVNDYCGEEKPYINTTGTPLQVNKLRGRANFTCQHVLKSENRVVDCVHSSLPCTRKLEEDEKRYEVALDCPHWSPVYSVNRVPDEVALSRDTYAYMSTGGPKLYYESKTPCPYYAQFSAYIPQGAIIMNAAKWEAGTWMMRKPAVPVEIIDEADDFLDGLSYQTTISRNTLNVMLREGIIDRAELDSLELDLMRLIQGSSRRREFPLSSSPQILQYVAELYRRLEDSDDSSLVGDGHRLNLIIQHQEHSWVYAARDPQPRLTFYIPRMDITLMELRKRSGKLVLMSATRHSDQVMRDIYGVQPPVIVAREENPGTLYLMTPREGGLMDVKYDEWKSPSFREEYWCFLDRQLEAAHKPCYVIVHAYRYLPGKYRPEEYEKKQETWTRAELPDVYFSTKIDRGKDLKGDLCRSIILLKHPFPNLGDIVLNMIKRQYGADKFWEYVTDHANRNLTQQCGRAIRSTDDWCLIYSPDINAVTKLERTWKGGLVKAEYG